MADRPLNPLLRFTRRLAAERAATDLTDGQLLGCDSLAAWRQSAPPRT